MESDKISITDFNATIAAAVGIDTEKIVYSPSRRPFTVANKGKVIDGVLDL